ncbi:hypothetical protein SAMD00019534_093210 [Acytostelium subglobosum LB1]|uniref:hypothetical protein n=1 Tax=Acytostelium subglobosum LB1 TaxID=1410327 RepID=UPI000644D115|nr:hypothetical protein SAMD00019534_093210 [Acytostelium subglobosum LB1]GAM26146.1 hypothetical protein SAMD00019534_093210 [Acytostelium subglobosum LB1]|eukprot:XP_012750700.1 hypothetical protein SAMD00019534_093210 [Acytostelium subglobosum LB1]
MEDKQQQQQQHLVSKDIFVEKTLKLLDIEKESEIELSVSLQSTLSNRELELKGICIRKLCLESFSTGLGGRSLVRLIPAASKSKQQGDGGGDLPPHKFTPGDVIGLRTSKAKPGTALLTGVVYRVERNKITVSFDDISDAILEELESGTFAIDKLANDITYRKMREAVERLRMNQSSGSATPSSCAPCHNVVQAIFSGIKPTHTDALPKVQPLNTGLNQPQVDAIRFALSSNEIALIHGPPGTGKTTTVVEFIVQVCKGGGKVLACGPSNLSVDNMLERLIQYPGVVNPTRIGHPARILPGLTKYTLDHKTKNRDDALLLKEMRREISTILKSLRDGKIDKSERRKAYAVVKDLRKDIKQRETSIMEQVIRNSNVILSTNTGASDYSIRDRDDFDWVIIDEAAQSLEASCWIPIQKGKRLLLAGDHQQLPPTIHSDQASKDGLSTTLFERLIKAWGDDISRLLSVQYRMNQAIMQWSSNEFYNGRMVAHGSVKHRLLIDKSASNRVATSTTCPLMMVDTSGLGMEESADNESESKFNIGEADLVKRYVDKLIKYGIQQESIGVITPYNGQVKQLKSTLGDYKAIEIGTVDGFQGREKEVIVLSLVRSNPPPHKVGFLAEDRRTNVAVTRAKRQVAIICDSETISSYPFLERMVTYFKTYGVFRSALEYTEEYQTSDDETWVREEDDTETSTTSTTTTTTTTASKARTSVAEQKKERKKKKKQDELAKKDLDDLNNPEKVKQMEHIKVIVESFIQSSNEVHTFPASLSAYQRLIVHQMAELHKLNHESTGEGDKRIITITKKPSTKSAQTPSQQQVDNEEDEEVDDEDEEDDSEEETNIVAGANNTSTATGKKKKPAKSPNASAGKKPPAKKKKKPATPKKDLGEELLSNFNNLEVSQIDLNVCGVKNCTANVILLGRICEFCLRKYCNQHALFEIHGCGAQAKLKARKDWFDAYAKSSKDEKTHNKLQQAIQDAESTRRKKATDKKTKK